VRRGALAKSISELASDWLFLTPDIVFLPCFYGIQLWIWLEPILGPRASRLLKHERTMTVFMQIMLISAHFSAVRTVHVMHIQENPMTKLND
jgi:hypothetical protein